MKTLADFRILIVPGLHGSGPGHWQTRWEELNPEFERVEQREWGRPDLDQWSAQVGHVLQRSRRPTIAVAHSFGCLATVKCWAAGAPNLAGALLVAPASPHKFGIAHALAGTRLAVPSLVIGSENDPWMPADQVRRWALEWGSEFVNAGRLGHINAESGLRDWPFGMWQLERLLRQVRAERAGRPKANIAYGMKTPQLS